VPFFWLERSDIHVRMVGRVPPTPVIVNKGQRMRLQTYGFLAAALFLASCGAFQRQEVKKTVQTIRVGDMCEAKIRIMSPQVHHPVTYLLGSRKTESIIRLQFPARRGTYLPQEVTVLNAEVEGQLDSTKTRHWRAARWNEGTVKFSGDKLDVELFDGQASGRQAFYNGIYKVEPASACTAP
jgi:hypothetical protein